MKCGCWIISIGPGCTPWMIMAAISTADGAEPGMPSARQGMMWPGIDDMSPVSAAIRPSMEPLPNFSGSLLAALAASKEPEKFGKGSIDGLMAAETGDMSSIPGHIIPCLALGIPGSAPSAVLMAAMIIHGVQPGPMLMIQHPHFIYQVVAMTTLASITILLFGLFGVRPLLHVLKVRRGILMPIVFLLCTVGAFATASRLFDIYAMLAIGIGAFFLRRRGYEMAPLVLGLVLGPLLDKSLRRGLVLSDGSLAPFFTRPICMAFAAVTIFTVLLYVPLFRAWVQ